MQDDTYTDAPPLQQNVQGNRLPVATNANAHETHMPRKQEKPTVSTPTTVADQQQTPMAEKLQPAPTKTPPEQTAAGQVKKTLTNTPPHQTDNRVRRGPTHTTPSKSPIVTRERQSRERGPRKPRQPSTRQTPNHKLTGHHSHKAKYKNHKNYSIASFHVYTLRRPLLIATTNLPHSNIFPLYELNTISQLLTSIPR